MVQSERAGMSADAQKMLSDVAMMELLHEWGILRDHNLLRDLAIVFAVSFTFFVWWLRPRRGTGARRPRRSGRRAEYRPPRPPDSERRHSRTAKVTQRRSPVLSSRAAEPPDAAESDALPTCDEAHSSSIARRARSPLQSGIRRSPTAEDSPLRISSLSSHASPVGRRGSRGSSPEARTKSGKSASGGVSAGQAPSGGSRASVRRRHEEPLRTSSEGEGAGVRATGPGSQGQRGQPQLALGQKAGAGTLPKSNSLDGTGDREGACPKGKTSESPSSPVAGRCVVAMAIERMVANSRVPSVTPTTPVMASTPVSRAAGARKPSCPDSDSAISKSFASTSSSTVGKAKKLSKVKSSGTLFYSHVVSQQTGAIPGLQDGMAARGVGRTSSGS